MLPGIDSPDLEKAGRSPINRADRPKNGVVTVKLFCALSTIVRLALTSLAFGVAAGIFLGVHLAGL